MTAVLVCVLSCLTASYYLKVPQKTENANAPISYYLQGSGVVWTSATIFRQPKQYTPDRAAMGDHCAGVCTVMFKGILRSESAPKNPKILTHLSHIIYKEVV